MCYIYVELTPYCFPSSSSSILLFSLLLNAIVFPPPPRLYCFRSSFSSSVLLFSLLLLLISIVSLLLLNSIVLPPLPPPPHFYCFPSTTTTTTFLLFHHNKCKQFIRLSSLYRYVSCSEQQSWFSSAVSSLSCLSAPISFKDSFSTATTSTSPSLIQYTQGTHSHLQRK